MIDAIYFDGHTARRYPVKLIIHKGLAALRGEDVQRSAQLAQLDISERLQHAPRILRFPDGSTIEAKDHVRLDKMLEENGYRTPRVVRWQNNWPLSLLALGVLITTLVAGYQWGVPLAADRLAQQLPAALEQSMGAGAMAAMDEYFEPSTLPAAEQARLRTLFASLTQVQGAKTAYQLEFRASPSGPNAFALPNGVIVMTDELVLLAQSDDAVLGVLSHELGHLRRHHSARHLLQALGVGVVLNLWLGDASSALAAAPAILLGQKHSRDFEREADGYAIDMMRANSRSLESMAVLFERMGASRAAVEDEDEDSMQSYLSSHPSDAERIAKLRAMNAAPKTK